MTPPGLGTLLMITLDEIRQLYLGGTANYRDSMLECGRLAHEYVKEQLLQGRTRTAILEEIEKHLGMHQKVPGQEIARLIKIWATAQLLSGGSSLGSMAFSTVREFTRLVRRPGLRGEEWEVIPELEDRARELWAIAVRDTLSATDVAPLVRKLRWQEAPPPPSPRRSPTGSAAKAAHGLAAMAAAGTVRDVTEMCLEIITASKDPRQVAERLMPILAKLQQGKYSVAS